jgi:multidrug resistance efflux pump
MKRWLLTHPKQTAAAAVAIVLLFLWLKPSAVKETGTTFTARRGALDITVLNGGSLESLESEVIRCEVRGEPVKILRLVDEGYTVTDEDVRTNKVLVELDSAKLQQNLVERDVSFQSASSQLTQATEDYEIQINQNRVDIRSFEQDARFAFMDLEKYLGERITAEVVTRLDLRIVEPTNTPPENIVPPADGEAVATKAEQEEAPREVIDFSKYAKAELLGDGTAKQEIRKREDELLVARTELGQAQTKLGGTSRLFEKGFVNKIELEGDQINADKARLKVESTQTALDLFIRYEFPKAAQEFVSKYDKALRALERTRKEAVSKLAQKRAMMKGAEGRFKIEKRNREELAATIAKCMIVARKPGMIVYGGGGDEDYWGGRDPIRVGSQVFERQAILTIPDTTKMGVKLGIHESHIKKITKGQKARIKADAFPDEILEGEVIKVGVLPDSRNRWMNPDMKLYPCTIAIQGTKPWLRPGMSAKIEVMVKQIPDCVYVPMQAVSVREGKQLVYLGNGGRREREVQAGEFNDEFIEIRSGLAAGEVVLLKAPDSEKTSDSTAKPEENKKDAAAASGGTGPG